MAELVSSREEEVLVKRSFRRGEMRGPIGTVGPPNQVDQGEGVGLV